MLKKIVYGTAGLAVGSFAAFQYYLSCPVETQFKMMSSTGPLLRMLDPELSHSLGITAATLGLFPVETRPDPEILKTTVWNRPFPNPIGLAAGFDKNAEIIEEMLGLGFGFVEVGTITPRPQSGNDKPRAFRIKELNAIVNRYGFNSKGTSYAISELRKYWDKMIQRPHMKKGQVGINIGKNKVSTDAANDYCICLEALGEYADFIVINISSPNTPGLRALQNRKELEELIKRVKAKRDSMDWGSKENVPPLLVKIAPDLSEIDKVDIAKVVLKFGVDGLVVSNTTIQRPGESVKYKESAEAGGLSGPPLFALSTQVLSDMYRLTEGKLPIIGVGGVSSGEDAYKKIRAGASLVELYTAMAYHGPDIVPTIKAELAACLKRDGFNNVSEAVGIDHRTVTSKDLKKGWLW